MTKKFNKGIRYSIRAAVFFLLASAFYINMGLATVNPAAAGNSGWWSKVQSGGLNQVGLAYETGQPRDARLLVIDAIRIILGILGILSVVLIVYAGFKWMLSRGNEEEVSTAKDILIAGVIGLVIILSAYILANFVINRIYSVTTGQPVSWDN